MTEREYQYDIAKKEDKKEHKVLVDEYVDYIIGRTPENKEFSIWLTKLSDGLYVTKEEIEESVSDYGMNIVNILYSGTCLIVA